MTHAGGPTGSAGHNNQLLPIVLDRNAPEDRPYRGGVGIARFRHEAPLDEWRPEDFVASTTEVFSGGGVGLTRLPDGQLLRDRISADPQSWLGPEHFAAWGADVRLLVKLLDTRERLFVHFHPDDEFATTQLGREYGKTEAWLIVAVDGPGDVWLGFNRDVSSEELGSWFESQNAAAMLAAMNHLTVRPGDSLLVPAAIPHAIGPGITLVELQQPVDLSIILEWAGYHGLTADGALLGLSFDVAQRALERHAVDEQRLSTLVSRAAAAGPQVFPREANRFFRADLLHVDGETSLEAGFSVLIVLEGGGRLRAGSTTIEIADGMTVLVPYATGAVTIEGSLRLIRARPPKP